MYKEVLKAISIVNSCKTLEQLEVAEEYCSLLTRKYGSKLMFDPVHYDIHASIMDKMCELEKQKVRENEKNVHIGS